MAERERGRRVERQRDGAPARATYSIESACREAASAIERASCANGLSGPHGLDELERSILESAMRRVQDEPHRFVDLGPRDPAIATLAGLASLRLSVLHGDLDPLEVGDARAAAAARLAARLDATERAELERLRRGSLDADVDLAHRTLSALHPTPSFVPHAPVPPEDLGVLVAAWEERRARPRPLRDVLAQKWTQNVQFFRVFGLAPLYAIRTARIRTMLPASVRANAVMGETFSALEQLGPVLDNFVFDRGLGATLSTSTAVCDFAFLYMQLADELVDNLVKNAGREGTLELLSRLYAPERRASLFVPLEDLDARALQSIGVDPRTPIVKYGLDHATLVATLRDLRATLLDRIAFTRDAERLRSEVSAFFHHCFATFLDELHLPDLAPGVPLDRLPFGDVAWHFFRKNNLVMTKWLAMRARLLGLDPRAMPDVLSRWGYVLANFQVFDDMKDLAVDLGHQPSYPLEIAWRRFPAEYDFLTTVFGSREKSLDRNEVALLATRVPRTILECLRFSKLMALAHFEWFTLYVWDYRWRRNWLVRARSFHLPPVRDVSVADGALGAFRDAIDTDVVVVDALFRFFATTSDMALELRVSDEYLAYALDVVAYDHGGAVIAAALPDVRTIYRFVNLRMAMPSHEKAALLRRLIRVHETASIRGLVGLRTATGSEQLARRFAEALDLPLPSPLLALGAARPS